MNKNEISPGDIFGRLTVIKRVDDQVSQSGRHKAMYQCKCACGNEVVIAGSSLWTKNTLSCGCLKRELSSERYLDDLTGKKFGKLTVLSRAENYVYPNGDYRAQWLCKCDCGNEVIVDGQNIKRGLTHSCGCIKSSIGEQLVQDYLDARGYTYETQVSLQGLVGVGGYELSYDFGVSMPKVGRVLIEYQGEQHYKIRDYFGGEEAFLKQQEHDKRKREFAAEHGCP